MARQARWSRVHSLALALTHSAASRVAAAAAAACAAPSTTIAATTASLYCLRRPSPPAAVATRPNPDPARRRYRGLATPSSRPPQLLASLLPSLYPSRPPSSHYPREHPLPVPQCRTRTLQRHGHSWFSRERANRRIDPVMSARTRRRWVGTRLALPSGTRHDDASQRTSVETRK